MVLPTAVRGLRIAIDDGSQPAVEQCVGDLSGPVAEPAVGEAFVADDHEIALGHGAFDRMVHLRQVELHGLPPTDDPGPVQRTGADLFGPSSDRLRADPEDATPAGGSSGQPQTVPSRGVTSSTR